MSVAQCASFLSQTAHYLLRSRSPYASVPQLQKVWADETLRRFQIETTISGKVSRKKSVLFVGNHISYLDIPLLMSSADDISFVAKNELAKWPVIGTAAKAMKTIFVNRESTTSRQAAREAIKHALQTDHRLVIFPSGTTTLDESVTWRLGAFEIAQELEVDVQPFRITYTPLKTAAFIGDDFFAFHLYRLSQQGPVRAQLEFASPVKITNAQQQAEHLQKWTQEWV